VAGAERPHPGATARRDGAEAWRRTIEGEGAAAAGGAATIALRGAAPGNSREAGAAAATAVAAAGVGAARVGAATRSAGSATRTTGRRTATTRRRRYQQTKGGGDDELEHGAPRRRAGCQCPRKDVEPLILHLFASFQVRSGRTAPPARAAASVATRGRAVAPNAI
jgi:hypothetical protein